MKKIENIKNNVRKEEGKKMFDELQKYEEKLFQCSSKIGELNS